MIGRKKDEKATKLGCSTVLGSRLGRSEELQEKYGNVDGNVKDGLC